MSIHWITWAWDNSPLRETKLLIHLALADIAHHDGRFFASQKRIAEMSRCTTKYVSQTVQHMEELGLIKIIEKGNGRGKATVYQLIGRSIERGNDEAPFTERGNTDTPLRDKTKRGNSEAERGNYEAERGNSAPNHSSFTPVHSTRPERSLVRKPINDHDPAFEEFWATYPRKSSKGTARRAWSKAVTRTDPHAIIEGARRYADDPNREDAFTAHAATWLNGERWLDEPLPNRESRSERKVSEVEDVIRRAAERDARKGIEG